MAKRSAKAADYKVHLASGKVISVHGTPFEVAKVAARHAKGTFIRSKSAHEQPDDAAPGQRVTVRNADGLIVMECSPSLFGRSRKAARHTFARCDVTPGFFGRKRRRR
jgi:hypothetical protein